MSHSEFGSKTTATEAAKVFAENIADKTILITGISPNSIGAALAQALAAHSPRLLILASRTPGNLHEVAQSIHSSHPDVRIKAVSVDLSSQKGIRKAADEIKDFLSKEGLGIDVLFNNAGINISQRSLIEEGIELQFGTNHVGPFLFTNLLLPLLLSPSSSSSASSAGKGQKRIVMTSSEAHRISPVRFSDYNLEPGQKVKKEDEPRRGLPKGVLRGGGAYEPAVAYGQSKTANVLFAVGLNQRLNKDGVKSFAVMPGTIMTDLVRGLDEQGLKGLMEGTEEWKTLDQGAATLVVAGFDPGLDDNSGVYLDDCQIKRPSKWAFDPVKAERLWRLSEELVGEKFGYGKESRL